MMANNVVRAILGSRRAEACAAVIPAFLGCLASSPSAGQPAFSEQTAGAGLEFRYSPPNVQQELAMFSGGTVGDFNNDGWPDLLALGGGLRSDALFINNRDGTFTDRAAAAGLGDLYWGIGASAADYDRDGDTDVYVTSLGDIGSHPSNGQHRLYRNNGDGTFTNVAVEAGVNATADYPDGLGATWGDYDLDGDLDLFVAGWWKAPDPVPGSAGNRLFRNELIETGQAIFSDVTAELGLFAGRIRAFGGIFADMNGDRYPELLIAGDFGTSRYYANRRDGAFGVPRDLVDPGQEKVWNGMGTTAGHFDRDGRLDWFVTAAYPAFHFAGPPGNFLFRNLAEGDRHHLVSLPESAGVTDGGWGWGTDARDFDHDGWADIVMTNGWNCDQVTGQCFANEPAYLFKNNGDLTFTEVAQSWGLDHRLQGRGLVTFDYDRDGDMDIVIFSNPATHPDDPPGNGEMRMYRNDLAGPMARWLEVRLDPRPNPALAPHGLGSRVTVRSGEAVQEVAIHGGSNYLSGSELVAHFGLAGQTVVDEVTVFWSDGFETRLTDVAADQILAVEVPLPHTTTPLLAGEAVDLTVVGLRAGEQAFFALSLAGTGDGPCPPAMGVVCADLAPPAIVLGSARAGADGAATLSVTVPEVAPGTTVFTQALIPRGPGGVLSLKSNVSAGVVE